MSFAAKCYVHVKKPGLIKFLLVIEQVSTIYTFFIEVKT